MTGMARRRSVDEIQQLVEQYRTSGKTRTEYCREEGLALSTLGRYMRRQQKSQHLLRVKVEKPVEPVRGFVLVLSNGRRIESSWSFGDAELVRLIRVAEAV